MSTSCEFTHGHLDRAVQEKHSELAGLEHSFFGLRLFFRE